MNELFDKLILRFFLAFFVCLLLLVYKYAHGVLYPSSNQQLFKSFYPSKNNADTIHLFARILGVGILFSEFHFYLSEGLGNALFYFSLQAVLTFAFYLLSLNIIESIVLYNFEYSDEILKRKNTAYAIICFSQAIAVAFVMKTVLSISENSLVLLFFLTLFSIVLTGFATKTFNLISKLPFNKLLVNKNMAISFSYMGFLWGWTLLICSSLDHEITSINWYAVQVVLKILLSLLIFPLFKLCLTAIFHIKEDSRVAQLDLSKDNQSVDIGYGIYEGIIFFTSCYLTTVITGQIVFGTFYPVF